MARVKGMVLSSAEGQAIILTPDGEYRTMKTNHPLEVGELYEDMSRPWWRHVVAAAVVLALTLGTLDYFRVATYAQVSGAVELGVNRWGRVISARALNDEGQQLLAQLDLKYMTMEVAMELLGDAEAELIQINAAAQNNMADTDTENNSALGLDKDRNLKEYPGKGADKGNKNEKEFVLKVEENMNQGYYKELESRKNQADFAVSQTIVEDEEHDANDTVIDVVEDNSDDNGPEDDNDIIDDGNDTNSDPGDDNEVIDDGSDIDSDPGEDTDNGHLDNRDGDRKAKTNNGKRPND
ncbi:MAG: anti-sigma factor domain-containing protein [Chloroflexi bacterium]|nr:anti-sigma factor domain-containing protein [Chloroflexota bacterium]